MKRFFLATAFLFFLIGKSGAQELNCQVQVLHPQIQGPNEKRIFENLQKGIFEFINNTKWTNDVFSIEERINCTMVLTITDKTNDQYKGNLSVISQRPVYKSGYQNCNLINYNDPDMQFTYVEFQPLDFSMANHISNLTSVLAYYSYVILALDYDSYSLNGGTPYWQKAQTIVSNAQNTAEKGWKSVESNKNRYWMVDNMLHPIFAPLRECMYKYHRLGLDVMYNDVNGGRAAIMAALLLLEKIHDQRPLSWPMQLFFNAKKDEIIKLFSGGPVEDKTKIVPVLQRIDPGNGIGYQKITQAQ
ncbi:MAG: DUF4835 family protein [Bacteroidota bacterium]|nr:DUF4835 family protein [Bacteroidota bacterium]